MKADIPREAFAQYATVIDEARKNTLALMKQQAITQGLQKHDLSDRAIAWFLMTPPWPGNLVILAPIVVVVSLLLLPSDEGFVAALGIGVTVELISIGAMLRYLWRETRRSRAFPAAYLWDRWAKEIVRLSEDPASSLFTRPLRGSELRYVHSQALADAKGGIGYLTGLFAFVVASIGFLKGKELLEQFGKRLGEPLPFFYVALLGMLGYFGVLILQSHQRTREQVGTGIDYYAADAQASGGAPAT